MMLDFKHRVISAVKRYPFKDRAFRALLVFVTILVTTRKNLHFLHPYWRLEPWESIAISAFSVAQLFEPRRMWFMFFLGVGFGDVLLYVSK
jgi:hypothetical protein